MVHERGDELAAVLPRQLALEKSRHRFPENLRAKQRRGEQRGERAGHRRRVHVTVFGRTKGDAGEMNSITRTMRRARQAEKANPWARQGGGKARAEVDAWQSENKTH